MHDAFFDRLVPIEPSGRDARCLSDRDEVNGALLFGEECNGSLCALCSGRCLLLGIGSQAIGVTCPLFGTACHACSSSDICSKAVMSAPRLATSCSPFSR